MAVVRIGMAVVHVCGASDDLISVEGDVEEEFGLAVDDEDTENDRADMLAFSDGTVLSVRYTSEGIWRIAPLVVGTARMTKKEGTDPDGDYTDHVTLEGDVKWVVHGIGLARATKKKAGA